MKSPIQQKSHLIKELILSSLTFQSNPHCGNEIFGWEGELAKEVAFAFMLLLLF